MKALLVSFVAAVLCVSAFAEDASVQEGVQKVVLKISTIETVGTRTQKTWNPPAMPSALQELPFSEQDLAKASPEDAQRMAEANHRKQLTNQRAQAAIALKAFDDATAHYKAVKAQLEGTTFGRQVILAVDKFTGMAGEYFDPDCIEFFHRMDMDEGMKEAYIKDMKSADLVTAPYFIKLVFDDPRVETGKTELNGQEIKMTKVLQTITYSVQELSGKVVTSGNVKKERVDRSTNAVVKTGADENMLIDVMEEALAEVAKKINSYFVAKASIKLIGPKGDKDFDEEAAIIEIDGTQYDADEEFSIMKGNHTVVVELDGYKQKGTTRISFKKDGKIKISMKKEVIKEDADEE